MTIQDVLKIVEDFVEGKNDIRIYELIILEKMGWKFDCISTLETSMILIRKYLEILDQEFNLETAQGYLQGFILVCSWSEEFLGYNGFEQAVVVSVAFLDLANLEDHKKGYLRWLYRIANFTVVRFVSRKINNF